MAYSVTDVRVKDTTLEAFSNLATTSFSSAQEALQAIVQFVAEFLDMGTSFLTHIELDKDRLELQSTYSQPSGYSVQPGIVFSLSDSLCETIARAPTPQPQHFEDVQHDPIVQAHRALTIMPDLGSYIGVPVTLLNGAFYGTLCAIDHHAHPFSQQQTNLLVILARLVATQVECERELQMRKQIEQELLLVQTALHHANESLAALAVTDALTGLPNHRALQRVFDEQFAPTAFPAQISALCFLDLDHFKDINDTYGHAAGDTALCELATLLRSNVQATDLVGRWGGEEFIIVLPRIQETDASVVAERLRAAIAAHCFSIAGGIHLTVSLGIAMFPYDASNSKSLLEKADQAMYTAKSLGRNRVCMYGF